MRCISWNNHSYSTAPHDTRLRALRINTFDIQVEWNMNFVALVATDRKVITFTVGYELQRHQCAWFQDLPCCKRRLYEEGSLDPTLSEHSRNETKSEIFGISTCVHAMSIIYRGTDIEHVVDTRQYTSHILVTRVSHDLQRQRSTNILVAVPKSAMLSVEAIW
jgi:hypothetical protein